MTLNDWDTENNVRMSTHMSWCAKEEIFTVDGIKCQETSLDILFRLQLRMGCRLL